MRFSTLYPLNNPAIQLKTGRPAPDFARARRLQITLVVAGTLGPLLFAPVTTFSLELGEASIKSGLGQSLVVEIPYRLASNEQLSPACISLVPAARAANALPTYTQVRRISLSSTHIEIFDDKSVREPLIGLNISVHCATAPHFVRSYQLFVDPPARMPLSLSNGATLAGTREQPAIDAAAPPPDTADRVPSATVVTAATSSPASAPTATTPRANPSPRARGQAGGDLTQGQTYRVVRGDTLSGIAARVAERPATIRRTADAIFAANPEAFTRGNPDLIKEGRSITVPIMTAVATPVALSSPAALPSSREAEAPTVAPVLPTVVPAPASAPQPLSADDAPSDVAPVASEPLPATAAVVEPLSALIPPSASTALATEAPSRATSSAWLTALLALGVVCLLSAPLAFARRRKQQARVELQNQRPRRLVEPVASIKVVEGQLPPAPSEEKVASTSSPELGSVTDSGSFLPIDLKDPVLTLNPTDPVDLNVGAPVVMNERVDWFAARATAPVSAAASGDETIEDNTATARMPTPDIAVAASPQSLQSHDSNAPVDDEQMTLTIVEMDMLRQDYEAQHTLTQHTSQALYDALADLNATKAGRAATAANSTLELPQQPQADATDSTARLPTARARMK